MLFCPKSRFRGGTTVETAIGFSILVLLVTISVAIYLKQFSYDPTLYQASAPGGDASTNSSRREAAVVPLNSTLQASASSTSASEQSDAPGASQADASAAATPASKLQAFVPQEFQPMGAVESFNRETLSDKIDGKAELYLEYGFQHMDAQRFADAKNPDQWFELYVYDMTNPLNAFTVYSNQRRPGVHDSPVAEFAYSTDNSLFLVQSKYYVEVVAAQANPALAKALEQTARTFVEKNPGEKAELSALAFFPKEGLDKGSIKLLLKDAFGFDKLNSVVIADYDVNGTTTTAFISVRQSPEEAQQLADAYYKLVTQDLGGEAVETTSSAVPNLKAANMLGDFEMFFAQGNALAGVHGAKSKQAGEALVEKLLAAIREKQK